MIKRQGQNIKMITIAHGENVMENMINKIGAIYPHRDAFNIAEVPIFVPKTLRNKKLFSLLLKVAKWK